MVEVIILAWEGIDRNRRNLVFGNTNYKKQSALRSLLRLNWEGVIAYDDGVVLRRDLLGHWNDVVLTAGVIGRLRF